MSKELEAIMKKAYETGALTDTEFRKAITDLFLEEDEYIIDTGNFENVNAEFVLRLKGKHRKLHKIFWNDKFAQEPKQYVDELKLVEKKLKSLDLLMQELDCKDFAELRKYARCGYQTFRNAKGANYDNIIIDEAVIPNEAIVEKSLKALEILKRNVKVSIEYGVEKRDISCALVFYIDNKKTIYVVDEAIKEKSPEHFKELELLKEVLE